MYTVAELIETLRQCPQDYTITISVPDITLDLESVGINDDEKTVDLFGED